MSIYEYIIGAILILASLLVIFVVLLQEGKQSNVGVISGSSDSYMDKGNAKTLDQKLAKWTKIIAISFFVLVFAGMLVSKFLSAEDLKPESGSSNTSSSVATSSTTGSSTTTSSTATTTSTTTVAEKK